MTAEEWQQELKEQLLEEIAAGVSDTNYYDDGSIVAVEVDYTTQSWPVCKLSTAAWFHGIHLPYYSCWQAKHLCGDEIQDMPGEIFDVPGIETVLVEDEDGNVGVDLTDVNNWPMMPLLPMTETMDNIVNRDELQDLSLIHISEPTRPY